MRLLPSWLFVPGHQPRMIDRAVGLEVGAAIFDLEDAVPCAQKAVARELLAAAIQRPAGGPARWVRTHPVGSLELPIDLKAVVGSGLDGLVIPKVQGVGDLEQLEQMLAAREREAGLEAGSVHLVTIIESARGLVNAPAIAAASPRLSGLLFGAEDFALDLGMFRVRGVELGDMLYARSAVAVAAASAGLEAIDRVWPDLRDPDGLRQDARQAREMGFSGKALIHPGQIDIVHEVFRPTPAEIGFAERVVQRFNDAAAMGAIEVDGQMIDRPVFERARRLLELARAPGAPDPPPATTAPEQEG